MMKRYAFTSLLFAVGIVGIAFFYTYVHKTLAASENVRIETLEGEENLLENVQLLATIDSYAVSQGLLLSKNQTDVITHTNFNWESLNIYRRDEFRVSELKEEYKSFFRGKYYYNPQYFYEDKDFLIYADLIYEEEPVVRNLSISLYDKVERKEWNHTVPMPAALAQARNIWLSDVQLYGQEVVLMVLAEQKDANEIWRVKMNVNQGKITDESLIHSFEKGEQININAESYSITKEKYVPVRKTTTIENVDGSTQYKTKWFVVEIESGEFIEMNMEEESDASELQIYSHDEDLYRLDHTKGELLKYNFTEGLFESVIKHEAFLNSILFEISDGKAYVLTMPNFYIFNIQSGQQLYHGEIKHTQSKAEEQLFFRVIYPEVRY